MKKVVKKEKSNRLALQYKRDLATAGISHGRVARESWRARPCKQVVSHQFITAVLNGEACPEWLRGLLDDMLAEAKAMAVEGRPTHRGRGRKQALKSSAPSSSGEKQ